MTASPRALTIRAGYSPILLGHFRNILTYFCRAVATEIVHLSGMPVIRLAPPFLTILFSSSDGIRLPDNGGKVNRWRETHRRIFFGFKPVSSGARIEPGFS